MLDVEYRPRAELDLTSAILYVGEVLKSPQAAQELYIAIRGKIEDLRSLPDMGVVIQDEMLQQTYRSVLVKNYRIFYTHDAHKLIIWRIVHTRQDIDDLSLIDFSS